MSEGSGSKPADDDVAGLITAGLVFAGLYNLGKTFTRYNSRRSQREQAKESARFYEAGLQHDNEGRLTDAVNLYNRALAKDPANSDAANGLAWILATNATTAEHLVKAMELVTHALRNAPDASHRANYLDTQGEINLRQGNFNEAAANFRECVRTLDAPGTFPGPLALYRLGFALVQLHDLPDAARALSQSVTLDPSNIMAHMMLANVARDLSDYDQAIREYHNAYNCLQQNRQSYDSATASQLAGNILNDLAATLVVVERQDDAEPLYRRAMSEDPNNPYPFANYAIIAGFRGKEHELKNYLNRALGKVPTPDEHLKAYLFQEAATAEFGQAVYEILLQNHWITFSDFSQLRTAWLRRREEQRKEHTSVNITARGVQVMPNSRDVYNISGATGAVGPGATSHGATQQFNQGSSILGADPEALVRELAELKVQLLHDASGADHYHAVGEIDDAIKAAEESNEAAVSRHLKAAGRWALEVATRIGTSAAAAAIKTALNLPS